MKLFNNPKSLATALTFLVLLQANLGAMELPETRTVSQSADDPTPTANDNNANAELSAAPFMINARDLAHVMGWECVVTYAIRTGNLELLRRFVNKGNINGCMLESYSIGLLHLAARLNQANVATFLIKLGIFVDLTDRRNETAVFTAFENGSLETLMVLLEHGATLPKLTGEIYLTRAIKQICQRHALFTLPSNESRSQMVLKALMPRLPIDVLRSAKTDLEEQITNGKYETIDFDRIVANSFTYLELVPEESRAFIRQCFPSILQEQAQHIHSLICQSIAGTQILLEAPPADCYFSLLPRDVRDLIRAKFILLSRQVMSKRVVSNTTVTPMAQALPAPPAPAPAPLVLPIPLYPGGDEAEGSGSQWSKVCTVS